MNDVAADPFEQFQLWFAEALGEMAEREAIALVTATPDGLPSARMVLMRHHDDHSFGWYTNYDSRKGSGVGGEPSRGAPLVLRAARSPDSHRGSVEKMTADRV